MVLTKLLLLLALQWELPTILILPLTVDGGMITVYIDGIPSASITVPRGQFLPKAVTFSYLKCKSRQGKFNSSGSRKFSWLY